MCVKYVITIIMSKLAHILEGQLTEAINHAGAPIIRRLYSGLRIEIMVVSNDVKLTLTRDNTYPSLAEWDTVLKHFPYNVPKLLPENKQQGSRYTISARFPSERTMQQKFF